VVRPLLHHLLRDPFFSQPSPKSTGKERFHLRYVESALDAVGLNPSLEDLVATLTELSAVTVSDAIRDADLSRVFVSGGGVRNPVLIRRMAELAPQTIFESTDAIGIPPDHKEAIAFALIGWATMSDLPANEPACTGARGPRVLGRITPAPGSRRPTPSPRDGWPTIRFGPGATSSASVH
jgi:anhydro-N-acetylmuramic acid kinase